MKNGLQIGTVVDKDSLEAVTDAVERLMNQPGDQETIRHAIDALGRMAQVSNVRFENVHIRGERTINIHADAEDDGDVVVEE